MSQENVEVLRRFHEGLADLRVVPEQIIDLGPRVALRAKLVGVSARVRPERAAALDD